MESLEKQSLDEDEEDKESHSINDTSKDQTKQLTKVTSKSVIDVKQTDRKTVQSRNNMVSNLRSKFKNGFQHPDNSGPPSKTVETMRHKDFVKTMTDEFTQDLDEAYEYNKAFSKHIAVKVNNLKRYEKQKRTRIMQQ